MQAAEDPLNGAGMIPLDEIAGVTHFFELVLSEDFGKEAPFVLEDLGAEYDDRSSELFAFLFELHIKLFLPLRSGDRAD